MCAFLAIPQWRRCRRPRHRHRYCHYLLRHRTHHRARGTSPASSRHRGVPISWALHALPRKLNCAAPLQRRNCCTSSLRPQSSAVFYARPHQLRISHSGGSPFLTALLRSSVRGHGSRRLPIRVRCHDSGEVGRLQVRPTVPTRGPGGWMEPRHHGTEQVTMEPNEPAGRAVTRLSRAAE